MATPRTRARRDASDIATDGHEIPQFRAYVADHPAGEGRGDEELQRWERKRFSLFFF